MNILAVGTLVKNDKIPNLTYGGENMFTLKDINGNIIKEDDIITYTLNGEKYSGIVKFGVYIQDGSGGEYSGSKCLGYYVERVVCLSQEIDNDDLDFEYYGVETKEDCIQKIIDWGDVWFYRGNESTISILEVEDICVQ